MQVRTGTGDWPLFISYVRRYEVEYDKSCLSRGRKVIIVQRPAQ